LKRPDLREKISSDRCNNPVKKMVRNFSKAEEGLSQGKSPPPSLNKEFRRKMEGSRLEGHSAELSEIQKVLKNLTQSLVYTLLRISSPDEKRSRAQRTLAALQTP